LTWPLRYGSSACSERKWYRCPRWEKVDVSVS
jgi:hypothetical protein